MKNLIVHLISDSTGETISLLSKAIFAQFDDLNVKEYAWSLTKNKERLDEVLSNVKKKGGIIIYTIAEKELGEYLEEYANENKIFCIEALSHFTNLISKYLDQEPKPKIGKQHIINNEYFQRIEAMNFTITHDDGQISENLNQADIILLGPSRTSKSPTSMYLAYKGFKTANIPLVPGIQIDETIFKNKNIFFIGLTIMPRRLVEIRKSRMLSYDEDRESDYTNIISVKDEIIEAKNICLRHNIPLLDVTRKSVEETAARIIQLYYEWKKS